MLHRIVIIILLLLSLVVVAVKNVGVGQEHKKANKNDQVCNVKFCRYFCHIVPINPEKTITVQLQLEGIFPFLRKTFVYC